jgi:thiamine biosynthesis lipoprotein
MQKAFCNINFKALGTDIGIDMIYGRSKEETEKFLEEIRQLYFDFEKRLSRFNRDSELFHLNDNLHFSNKASHDILELSSRCFHYFNETEGLFDPRVIDDLERIGYRHDFKKGNSAITRKKSNKEIYGRDLASDISIDYKEKLITFHARMDFGGIAKGYFTDKISKLISEKGYDDFIVDSGGDMYVSGRNMEGGNWKIGIESIEDDRMILLVENMAVATSGISRRKWEYEGEKYHHLINPKNPYEFSHKIKTVTVVADNTEYADVWAKTLFILGKDLGLAKAEEKKLPCIFLMYDGSVFHSSYLNKFLFKG